MSDETIPETYSGRIYDILVEDCLAPESWRNDFICQEGEGCREYRFQGTLGMGGTFHNASGKWYVSCYSEDGTLARVQLIDRVNQKLAALKEFHDSQIVLRTPELAPRLDPKHSNKEAATSFLRLVTSGKIQEAFDRYVGPGFRHHNPYFKGDANSLMAAMEENEIEFPNKGFQIHRALAEGDEVAVHSHVTLKPEFEFSAIHLFRFHDKRIVEVWDVLQQVSPDSPNENGMF